MWVLKLGGSLAGTPALGDWARMLARAGAGRCVVVPGGGPFADQVRRAQRRWGIDDATAHRMALSAMDQFGLLLTALAPGLASAAGPEALRRALAAGQTPVWLPAAYAGADPDLPRDWHTTSDSLSAWLATDLGADALVLVKSVQLRDRDIDVRTLVARGIVDAALPARLARGPARVYLAAATAPSAVALALASGDPGGLVRVTRDGPELPP